MADGAFPLVPPDPPGHNVHEEGLQWISKTSITSQNELTTMDFISTNTSVTISYNDNKMQEIYYNSANK